jgi:hypothetical protein
MTVIRLPLGVRFWPKVRKTTTCWLFTGRVRPDGYGTIRDEEEKHTPAHRAAWRLVKGPIPEGLCVLHVCDVRHCVNPDHLFLGTNYQNKLDEMNKNRHVHGETHPMARLSEQDVRDIRQSAASGATLKEQAAQYHCTYQNIRHIVTRHTWKNVK